MRRYGKRMVLLLAVLSGVLLSFTYINPYSGRILLSELILQLSGSRGEFALGFSAAELISFAMRQLPLYIFELYFGIELYRHFCTASIYVFSRYPKRIRWYLTETILMAGNAAVFQVMMLAAVIGTSMLRYQVQADIAGVILLLYHFFIYFVWMYVTTLAVNLFAVLVGSSTSYSIVVGIQIVMTALLGCGDTMMRNLNAPESCREILMKLNPVSRLVIGWHKSGIVSVDAVLGYAYEYMRFKDSIILCILCCILVLAAGAVVVNRHELLISDSEMGVM